MHNKHISQKNALMIRILCPKPPAAFTSINLLIINEFILSNENLLFSSVIVRQNIQSSRKS